MCRLTVEFEAAVVERDDAIPRCDKGWEVISPGIHRRADPMNEHDGSAGPGVDPPESRSIDSSVLRAEGRPGRIAARFGNRGRATGGRDYDDREDPRSQTHATVGSARRASNRMSGCEVQSPVTASPSPDVITTWVSSIMSIVTAGESAAAGSSQDGASAGIPPRMRTVTCPRSLARLPAGQAGPPRPT